MIAVLVDAESQGQIFYQYCVCIYVKAIFHLVQMPRIYKNSTINQQFLKSKRLYESYALHALKHVNFLGNPTLPFIQSLISAVCLEVSNIIFKEPKSHFQSLILFRHF